MSRRARLLTMIATVAAMLAAPMMPAFAQSTVLVPTRVIYPGETISPDSIEEVPLRRQLKNPGAVASHWQQVGGKVAKRTLLPGRLISISSVRNMHLVEPGKPVQVRYVHGGLEIGISAVPLQAGAAGDQVQVRNIDSGAVFIGTVMTDGTVRVSAS